MLKLGQSTKKAEITPTFTPTKPKSQVTFVNKTIGGDTYLVMAQSQIELEDEFSSLYYTASNQSNLFLMPPFEPNVLMNLVITNNILSQCIDAMEVNIDSTGITYIPAEEGGEIDEDEKKEAEAFFGEPYPYLNFVKIRRKLRRQMESIGYGFLEVLRNINGDIIGLRNIETNHVRMVKLDAPILVTKTLNRNGKDVQVTMWDRERRFAQRVALKQLVYYREFGTTRQVNRDDGKWETDTNKIAPKDCGTELLMFGINPDITTPYFLPRWINDMPSVIGSRKAEEQNLQFLDSGGMPPAIIFIQGGVLAKDTSDQLRMYLSGQNKNKYRAVVIEAQASSGSIDSAGTVSVKVERFGSQGEKDAMFMKYDESTEKHVRVSFRLPPLFLGDTGAHNFATASISYMIAEAQVFSNERADFDTTINNTIVKAMGWKTLRIKSVPITLKDIASILKGMELAKDLATRESFLDEINTSTGTTMELAAMPQPDQVQATEALNPPGGAQTVSETPHEELPASTKPPGIAPRVIPEPQLPGQGGPPKPPGAAGGSKTTPMAKTPPAAGPQRPKKAAMELITLAHEYAASMGLVKKRELSADQKLWIREEVEKLEESDLDAFNTLLAQYAYGQDDLDLVEIASHAYEHGDSLLTA
jgi:PBSX family phage portal protein